MSRDYRAEHERARQIAASKAAFGHEKIGRQDMKKLIVRGEAHNVSGSSDTPHWKCADCGLLCYCVGDARLMPHPNCGRPGG